MHSHKKIRIAFQRVKLQLCSTLRRTHAERSTAVSLRLRNEKLCTTRLLTSCKLIIFGWICLTLIWLDFIVCVFSLITYIMYNSVTYGERAIFFCVLLFVFPCSCTGCGVCPTLQLSAGQDTSLVQCVTQAHLTLPGPGAIWYFLKGHVMDSSNVSWCSTCQHYVV